MKNKFLSASLILAASIFSFSCSKKIDEAYANPNADVRVPVEQLLPQIVSAMAGNYAGHGTMTDIRYIGAYIQNWQYYSTQSNYDRMGYTNSSGDVSQSTWRMHYYDIGQNNVQMIKWAIDEKKWDYAGVGKAIFAWSWLTLTDYYGDVILKDAFNTDLVTFRYDTQPEVYEYVRQLCFEALTYLNKTGDNASATNLAKGDTYMYNGDVNKWKKFVYGILARYHNHLSNKTTYNPDSVIYYCNLSINDNADNAMVKFAGGPLSATNNFFGPFRGNLGGATAASPTAIRQGAYIANLMNGTNPAFLGVKDPRTWYMLRPNYSGTFVGIEPNKGQTVLTATTVPENFWGVPQDNRTATAAPTSIITNNTAPATDANARYIFRNTSPFPIMTATEIKFMKAEAAFRKAGATQVAYDAYKDAISTDFDMLTTQFNVNIPAGKEITPADKLAYLNNTQVVPPTAAELTLSKIMLQKYIAMFGYGVLETWVDMRRYHYIDPDPSGGQVYAGFTPPTGGDLFPDNVGKLVYRVRPRFNSEYVWNILELQRIGGTQNDYHTYEMWFSKK
ncbi:MAG: SusD/RagB family nutrient-binding outer membrane lipoprotein [Chitinophagaceae bacterium]|nr:MAG: SusD/RagB family nutrient-binding outer membrane lipoprotein [Chitinophagaceae bacterium]